MFEQKQCVPIKIETQCTIKLQKIYYERKDL